MTIICGTDFSVGSAQAQVAAVSLAKRLNEKDLRFIHVLHETTTEEAHDRARRRLEVEAGTFRPGLPGVDLRCAVAEGSATAVLIALAEAAPDPLLVVGSRGRGDSRLFRLGSSAERLAQATRVPLLVVRDAAPFDAWAAGDRPLRLFLAADWTASCEPAIQWVRGLRGRGVEVVVGHAYSPPDERRRYGLPPGRTLAEPDPEVEQLLVRDLAARVGDLGGPTSIRPTLGIGRTGDHLVHLAEAERADAIVIGTHRRRGLRRLGSVTPVVLHQAACPAVVVVPRAGDFLPTLEELSAPSRVLVATDLSPDSNRAVPQGYALLPAGGDLHLLHVLPEPGTRSAPEQEVAAQLRALVPAQANARGVSTWVEVVRHANPAVAITETARRVGADLVCVATHARSGVARAALGSITGELLRECPLPVLVVRPPPA